MPACIHITCSPRPEVERQRDNTYNNSRRPRSSSSNNNIIKDDNSNKLEKKRTSMTEQPEEAWSIIASTDC